MSYTLKFFIGCSIYVCSCSTSTPSFSSPSFSSPANSTPPRFMMVRHFPLLQIPVTRKDIGECGGRCTLGTRIPSKFSQFAGLRSCILLHAFSIKNALEYAVIRQRNLFFFWRGWTHTRRTSILKIRLCPWWWVQSATKILATPMMRPFQLQFTKK